LITIPAEGLLDQGFRIAYSNGFVDSYGCKARTTSEFQPDLLSKRGTGAVRHAAVAQIHVELTATAMDGGEFILNVGRVVETFAVSSPHTRGALELDRNLRLATNVPPYYALPYSRERASAWRSP